MTPPDADLEDRLLRDPVTVLTLRLGFRFGVLPRLAERPLPLADLNLSPRAGARLMALLRQQGLAEDRDGTCALEPAFASLVQDRGASLAARAEFAAQAMADLLTNPATWLTDRNAFVAQADTFGFFDYARATQTKAAALEDSARWVRYVTALSERESVALAPHIPVEDGTAVLEVGGNTGEMALALLARYPTLSVTVFDLPAVCRLGARHAQGRTGQDRLKFVPGDAHKGTWPYLDGGWDTVLFKSVLHDWSDTAARAMLNLAAGAVRAGGRVIVCERGRCEDEPNAVSASDLVFAPFYRSPDWYAAQLGDVGLRVGHRTNSEIGMQFHIVWAECQ